MLLLELFYLDYLSAMGDQIHASLRGCIHKRLRFRALVVIYRFTELVLIGSLKAGILAWKSFQHLSMVTVMRCQQ